ncbi:MFS transporter [Herbaspirillum sp. LeCh32-8]|uniref:MFS transporter n=1 Tax=Herbaspirillum sp. LeCh32-8 TaxID=2821356 RepID=UPI001AE108C4|nr:MFS transporter [Herbaspirillum sp. LeCh32-8]MBP0600141.1 MFS transporter [Herbaspirillum sp. LeCh32-8]
METALNDVPDSPSTPPQSPLSTPSAPQPAEKTGFRVLGAISFSHFLNDMIQSLLLAIYPLLKSNFHLSFAQIGLITLTFQVTASLLQPLVGLYTDKHPRPYSLAIGMGSTLCGLLLLSVAPNFGVLLLAAALVGTGSSVFHPEASRVARMASGGRHGLAQSLFQVGGNAGSAMGPLLAAWIIIPGGQGSVAWFAIAALVAIVVLRQIGHWYARQQAAAKGKPKKKGAAYVPLPKSKVTQAVSILLLLIFSKYFYMASLSSYFTFYLISKFQLSVQDAQLHLFAFLFAVAVGTVAGGPIGDRVGRKAVIWVSILGVAPFTLMLPYANLFWTGVLSVIIGLILASAFSAILVFAQELMPGKIGTVSGLFFGFAFGMGGIGAALLGKLADLTDIYFVYQVCAFLPLIGLLAAFLPKMQKEAAGTA